MPYPDTSMDSLLLFTLYLLKPIVDFEKVIVVYPKLQLKKVKLVEVQGVPLLASVTLDGLGTSPDIFSGPVDAELSQLSAPVPGILATCLFFHSLLVIR